jgi:mono/diheme cytochrome c family protein
VFYAPNITPDPEHGIGGWSAADFRRALVEGRAPHGGAYFPVFPYTAYTRMTDRDVADLWAYLQSVPGQPEAVPEHEPEWYLRLPGALALWRLLNFEEGPVAPVPGESEVWHRGRYLAEALAHCGECHTPRDWMGGLLEARRYAGAKIGPDGERAPNITPHREAGIGRWSVDDLAFFLEIGMTPGGDFTGGSMADVVDGVTAPMTAADRAALAAYVLSLPPVAGYTGA